MKPVRYVGPSGTGVKVSYLADPSQRAATVVSCQRGETVQLPDVIADAYIACGIFEDAGPVVDAPAEEKPKRAKTAPTEQKEAD